MSALEALEAREIEVVGLALNAVVNGEFFADWEFDTLFGVSREAMRAIAAGWPGNMIEPDTEAAVFNALANLQGYPHGLEGALGALGLTTEAVGGVLEKLQRGEGG